MNKSVSVPQYLYDIAAEYAAREHISVDEFVSSVVADRLASSEYRESRVMFFSGEEFEWALGLIPEAEPEDGGRL